MRPPLKIARTRLVPTVYVAALLLIAAGCTATPEPENSAAERPAAANVRQHWKVCGNTVAGPDTPPAGAVRVDPAGKRDLAERTAGHPPGTTFWLAPGTHTLSEGKYSQVRPKDGNVYLGAQGAVLDGQGRNLYAFTGHASHVTIRYLTIQGFAAPRDQGVVNHDSGNGWVIEHNTIQNNDGAALMAGSDQVVRGNCLRDNGQYAMNAYQAGSEITNLLIAGNEIVGNNTGDWESKIPGCGCTGGMKFWSVDGAVIKNNWIHDNHGPGVWGDTNNNDFLIEHNLLADNEAAAIIYETSYNAVIRDNIVRGNSMNKGKSYAEDKDDFPVAAVYISESGGDPRVPARTDKIEIYDNVFKNNWSGITLWENADRFCNSPANTSTGICTLVLGADQTDKCVQPGISSEPLYGDCRWKTQRVDIHHNEFIYDPSVVGCAAGFAGRMAVLSNYGTYPDWSPYQGTVVQEAVTFHQHNRWHDNTYKGPWTFVAYDANRALTFAEWRASPYSLDAGSTFDPKAFQGDC